MRTSMQSVMAGVSAYIDREIAPMGATMKNLDQFLFGVKVGIIRGRLEGIVRGFVGSEMAKTAQLVDEEGNIDIDTIYQASISSMSSVRYIDIAGIQLNETDLNKLYNYIKERS